MLNDSELKTFIHPVRQNLLFDTDSIKLTHLFGIEIVVINSPLIHSDSIFPYSKMKLFNSSEKSNNNFSSFDKIISFAICYKVFIGIIGLFACPYPACWDRAKKKQCPVPLPYTTDGSGRINAPHGGSIAILQQTCKHKKCSLKASLTRHL